MKHVKKFNENFDKTNEFYYDKKLDVPTIEIGGGENKEDGDLKKSILDEIQSKIKNVKIVIDGTTIHPTYEFYYFDPKLVRVKVMNADENLVEEVRELVKSMGKKITFISDNEVTVYESFGRRSK